MNPIEVLFGFTNRFECSLFFLTQHNLQFSKECFRDFISICLCMYVRYDDRSAGSSSVSPPLVQISP